MVATVARAEVLETACHPRTYIPQAEPLSSLFAKFDPAEALQALQDHKVTATLMVPTALNVVVNLPTVGDYDLGSLRRMLYGASPMPQAIMKKAMQVFPTCGFTQGYGMTELSPVATFLDAKYHALDGPFAGKLASAEERGVDVPPWSSAVARTAPRSPVWSTVREGAHASEAPAAVPGGNTRATASPPLDRWRPVLG